MYCYLLLISYGVIFSIGGLLFRVGDSLEMIFECVDKVLYEVKDGGKDIY